MQVYFAEEHEETEGSTYDFETRWDDTTGLVLSWAYHGRYSRSVGTLLDTDAPVS